MSLLVKYNKIMCRNIKTLYNFDPPATEEEIREASIQFVRKISGIRTPSSANELAFARAVDHISSDAKTLLQMLITNAAPKNRDIETMKLRKAAIKRFGPKTT